MREPRRARDSIEWPTIAPVLAVDDQTVAFWLQWPPDRITLCNSASVDICGDVDKTCLLPGTYRGRAWRLGRSFGARRRALYGAWRGLFDNE